MEHGAAKIVQGGAMKAMMKFYGMAAAALGAIGLAGCNSVTTAGEEPTFPVPAQKVVVGGTVSGLSATRPLELSVEFTNNGLNSGTTIRSVVGTNVLRLGAIDVGGGYNVTVSRNPFGRVCTVANGTGVATAAVDNITVTCVRDPAVPLYTATLNIAPALANALPAGFQVSLTTEDGIETIAPAPGQLSVVFTNPILASGSNLPLFTYTFGATFDSGGTLNNCAITGATNVAGGSTVAPTGNVSGTVSACAFTIAGTVGYAQPPHIAYTSKTITGLQLALVNQFTQQAVETVSIPPFTPATATATTPYTFAAVPSNATALYEVAVATQPTGMHCLVDHGGLASLMVRPSTSSSGVTSPATQPANITATTPFGGAPSGTVVRCRDLPAAAGTLVGIYQVVGQDSTFTTVAGPNTTVVNTAAGTADPDGLGTTTTTTVNAGTPTVATSTSSDHRRFISFFANGTFLYATHGSTTVSTFFGRSLNTCTTCGLEYGFYFYDNVANNLYFTIRTDTNGTTANSLTAGLSGMPGPVVTGSPTMTGVVKTVGGRGELSGVFGPAGTGGNATTNRSTWSLLEPVQTAGELEGAWATSDAKRVFVYTKAGQRTAFHFGINGAPNMQDGCIGILNASAPSGFWTPRDRSTGCSPGSYSDPNDTTFPVANIGGFTPIDIPEAAGVIATPAASSTLMGSNQAIWPGYQGRMPGLQSNDDVTVPPSPVNFAVTAGAVDALTVQATDNGTPVRAPILMQRVRPN